MPDRKYRPGSRNPRFRPGGRMSDDRYAWLRCMIGQFVIMKYDDEVVGDGPDGEEDTNEYGPTVRLVLPRTFGAPIKYNLTALTLEELEAMRKFFNLLFELAEPTVRERDRIAHEAYEAGDDSFARVYRQVPQFVVRGRPSRSDGQSVHDRPSDDASGPSDAIDSDSGLRGDGSPVADHDEEDREAQDDDAEADQPKSLREVGGDASDPDGLQGTDSSED